MAIDMDNLLLIEKSLIRGTWDDKISKSSLPSIQLSKLVVECRFREVLKSQQALSLFRPLSNNAHQPFEDVLVGLASTTEESSVSTELTRLVLAIACLHAFVQANWTGPDIDIHPLELLTSDNEVSINWTEELLHTKSIQELARGGEPAYHLSKVPAFLRFAQILISLPYEHLHSVPLWTLRVASVHLQVLDEPVALHEDFHTALQPLLITFASEAHLSGQIYLELGILEHLLTQDKAAAECFIKAAKLTGLQYELSGALGKRTRFQVTEVAQLILLAESHLRIESEKELTSDNNSAENILPETLALNDDTLLEQTEFTSSHPGKSGSFLNHINPSSQPSLHPLDQCILISLCLNIRNTSPSHGLTTEQMYPYISRVISQPINWSVHTMALLLRSRLESSRTRTVERSTLQLQALMDQLSSSDSTNFERLLYFHTILLPPKWELERELAQRYLSLGVVKSALEIFERLEMWEDVVKCYGVLQQQEKGVAIVRDLLEGKKEAADAVISRGKVTSIPKKKTEDATRQAKILCLLGDLEPANAIDHYEKAWIISNETSGRAMRSLGGHYFARAKYQEAIECLQKAVKINPLLAETWFILGCAYMRIEDWEKAKVAFSRCVVINEDDGESWNNLASMYLRIGETVKERAFRDRPASSLDSTDNTEDDGLISFDDSSKTISFENKLLAFQALKQGLRCNYENWRMWYNYMIVSLDIGEMQETCKALSRLVALTADKAGPLAVDEDVLDRLVDAVTSAPLSVEEAMAENSNQSQHPNEGHGLYRNVLQVLEGTILPRLSSSRIFRAYARLLSWQKKWGDAVKAYLDAYRCSTGEIAQESESDLEKWRVAVRNVEEIVDTLRNLGPKVQGYNWKLQARSILRTFIGRSQDFQNEPEWEILKLLQAELRIDKE